MSNVSDNIERLETGLELAAWRRAALAAGLYRSDTDVSTAEKWQTAQVNAAAGLLSRIAELEKILALEKREAANRLAEVRQAHAITRGQLDARTIERDENYENGKAELERHIQTATERDDLRARLERLLAVVEDIEGLCESDIKHDASDVAVIHRKVKAALADPACVPVKPAAG